jgi:hypothetical protein
MDRNVVRRGTLVSLFLHINNFVLFPNPRAYSFWSGKLEEALDQGEPAESELSNRVFWVLWQWC